MSGTVKILVIIVAVLLILCLCLACLGGVAYWQKDQVAELLGLQPQVQAAQMMPADTALYYSLSLNLQAYEGYQNLKEAYLDNPEVKEALDEFLEDIKDETDISFEQDIQPWMGSEAALAILDVQALIAEEPPNLVLAVATRDLDLSDRFLEKLRSSIADSSDESFSTGDYQGVHYWYLESESRYDPDLYQATVNDFVVLTTSEGALFGAIDRLEGNRESLADDQDFQATIESLPPNGVFFTFVNWDQFADELMAEAPVEIEGGQVAELEAVQSAGMAVTLQPDGLQLDAVVQIDQERLSEQNREMLESPDSPNKILQQIPADAILFANGYNFNRFWMQLRDMMGEVPDFDRQIQDMEDETGINIDRDVFGWMTGEYALVLIEVQSQDEYALPLGGYALIGTDDLQQAQSSVDRLAVLTEEEMYTEYETRTIDGHEVHMLVDPYSMNAGGYAFWDDFVLIAYPDQVFRDAFGAPDNPISKDANFQSVRHRLPGENYGYFYVDGDAVRSLVESQMDGSGWEDYQQIRPFVEPLRAFGAAVGPSQGELQTIRMFLLIER